MKSQSFRSKVVQMKGRGFIEVPFDPDGVWGRKERHYITGTVNGCTVRGRLESVDGKWMLSLGPVWRRDNGVEIGSEVEVTLTPEGPQGDRLSDDVAAALDSAPDAKAFFEGLATFYRKNFIRWIESAKRPETRAGRIREMVALLKTGKREK